MKIRIDRVRDGPEEQPIDRWELWADESFVLPLEAEDLRALTEAALLAEGLRQGLVLREGQPAAPAGAPAQRNPARRGKWRLERARDAGAVHYDLAREGFHVASIEAAELPDVAALLAEVEREGRHGAAGDGGN